VRETTLQKPRSLKKEGEEVLQVPEQRLPCSPWSRPWWGRLCPCSPWRSMVEQISTCSLGRTPHWSRWVSKGGCDPLGSPALEQAPGGTCGPMEREAHAGAGLLAGLVTLWGDPRWSSLFLKGCTL